jgi:hypothetical protein
MPDMGTAWIISCECGCPCWGTYAANECRLSSERMREWAGTYQTARFGALGSRRGAVRPVSANLPSAGWPRLRWRARHPTWPSDSRAASRACTESIRLNKSTNGGDALVAPLAEGALGLSVLLRSLAVVERATAVVLLVGHRSGSRDRVDVGSVHGWSMMEVGWARIWRGVVGLEAVLDVGWGCDASVQAAERGDQRLRGRELGSCMGGWGGWRGGCWTCGTFIMWNGELAAGQARNVSRAADRVGTQLTATFLGLHMLPVVVRGRLGRVGELFSGECAGVGAVGLS